MNEWAKQAGEDAGKKFIELFEGKELIFQDEMIGKIKAAYDAKMEEDPNFILGARTDAISVYGFSEAIKRANAYAMVGADFIFLDAPETEEEVRNIPKLIDKPVMLNLIEGGKTPLFTFKEVEDMGYKILAIPLTALYSATKAMLSTLESLKMEYLRIMKNHGYIF